VATAPPPAPCPAIRGWLDVDVKAIRTADTTAHLPTPGSADVDAMGGNLMNTRRRKQMLDTVQGLGYRPRQGGEHPRANAIAERWLTSVRSTLCCTRWWWPI
jgi:hypothetical protein